MQNANDLTGSYLNERQNANLTPAQRLLNQNNPQPEYDTGKEPFSFSPGKIVKDVVRGVVESPKQVMGGAAEAIKEAGDSLGAIADFFNMPTTLQIMNEKGEFDLDLLSQAETEASGITTPVSAIADNTEPASATGGLIRGVAQFLTGFLPATRALKGVKAVSTVAKLGKVAAAGSVADATVFDPHEQRLSNLVQEFPALQNPVTEFLAASPDDGEALGRFKNAVEGLGLGVLSDGFIQSARGIRASRGAKLADAKVKKEKAQIKQLASVADKKGKVIFHGTDKEFDEFDVTKSADGTIWFTDRKESIEAGEVAASGKGRIVERVIDEENLKLGGWDESDNFSTQELIDQGYDGLKLEDDGETTYQIFHPEKLKKVEVEPEFKPIGTEKAEGNRFSIGSTKAGDERALNINLDRLDTEEDVTKLIEGYGKTFSKDINEARREVITLEETEKLADDLGMTVKGLLERRRGEAFNAEQATAARKILVASGENLINLAKKAEAGSEAEVFMFRKALAQHHAIQSQVSGLTSEAGRALSSFRIAAKSGVEQQRLISEALEVAGGADSSRALAKMVGQMETSKQLNQFAKLASRAKTKDALYEAWINGLLSSPATHTVNAVSNALVAGWAVGERKVASLIGRTLDVQSIPEGEATAQLYGMMNGAREGMSLAWKALKTGEPADVIGKIETGGRKAISSEALGLSGMPGMFADYLGTAVRTPSRFLTAGDELFKTIGYRMELHAQAFRQGMSEGLEGEELARRMQDIIDNPPENINLASIDASRYQTFTKPLGESGAALQTALAKTPGARIVVPFLRTPTNIIKFVGERTPLAPFAKSVREDLMAGGARRDFAMAKIATGSMIMAAAADMTLTGSLTGAGPVDPDMKRIWREKNQPYSKKFGDRWVSYQRLDPIGATIGLAADVAEIIGQMPEADALDLATSVVIAVGQNLTSKTYLSGLADFFEVMAGVSPDPENRNTRAKMWIERLAGSVVPAGVAQLERTISPELSATEGIVQKLKSRIPGFSEDLPGRKNIFGETIVLSGGIGPDIMSPFYQTFIKEDPVVDEILAQKTPLRMPLKTIDGVRLSEEEYAKYVDFYSGKNNKYVKNIPLKTALSREMRTPTYKNATDGPEGGKSMIIRTVFEGYRESAKQMMIENSRELKKEIIESKKQKAFKLGAR